MMSANIQRCMIFTENIVVGENSGKVMYSGKDMQSSKVMGNWAWCLRKFPLKS